MIVFSIIHTMFFPDVIRLGERKPVFQLELSIESQLLIALTGRVQIKLWGFLRRAP